MKNLILIILLIFIISCSSGGGGSDDHEWTAPVLSNFIVHGHADNPYVSSKCQNTYLLDTNVYFEFQIYDPDKDASKLFFIIHREDGSVYEEGSIVLPQQQETSQIYQTEWIEERLDEEGYFTLTAYVVDAQGLESENFTFEGCVFEGWQV